MGIIKLKMERQALGPPGDDYFWTFSTSDSIDIASPKLTAVTPNTSESNVPLEAPLIATFNKPMSVSSFSNILFKTSHGPIWYFKTAANYTVGDVLVANTTQETSYTKAIINHAPLLRANFLPTPMYYPFLPPTINDLYQNCFYPAVGPSDPEVLAADRCTKANLADTSGNTYHSCYNGKRSNVVSTCETGDSTCPPAFRAIKNTSQ
jgi:hypothetical protein